MNKSQRRRLAAQRRALVPKPLPDFSTMTQMERLMWEVEEYGLETLIRQARELAPSGDAGDSAAEPPESRLEAEPEAKPPSVAEAEPPQVEIEQPPPPPPKARWETMVRWRQRGPEDYDDFDDVREDDDDFWS